jgi:aldose 1-epimerase
VLNQTTERAPDGQPWRLITLRNDAGMVVTLMDWGATLLSARVTLADGSVREALLGCASPQQYTRQAAFLGASVGRYANRIANSRFMLDGHTVNVVPSTDAGHQLHGGPDGFDKRRWQIVSADERQALFSLSSADGDQGFPGALQATAHYRLTDDNRIAIEYRATVDRPCPVNLTNHVYFNLDGQQTDVRQHRLQLFADRYLPVESDGIPGGDLRDVAETSFDFREPQLLAERFLGDDDQRKVKGYDHAFLLQAQGDAGQPAAHLWSQDEKLQMTVYTSAPALQFYSGNYLGGTPSRTEQPYADWQGLALESEFLPDSPNHPHWPQPDCVLRPGEEYVSLTEYQFIAR